MQKVPSGYLISSAAYRPYVAPSSVASPCASFPVSRSFLPAACTQRTVIDAERNPAQVPVFHYDEDLGGAVSEKFMKTQDTYYVKEVEIPESSS